MQRILVRAVNWIGDAVITTPAIGAIRQTFPHAEITILANPLVSQLFSPHQWVDRVVTFDRKGKHRGIIGRIRLARELRRYNFDLAIILPNSFDSALVPWLAGIPARFGKRSDGRSLLLTAGYSPEKQATPEHEIRNYIRLLDSFGIKGEQKIPQLFTTPEEDYDARSLLSRHGIKDNDFVLGINPGATFGSAKRWYPERFAEVARRLVAECNARPVIFGSPDEFPIATEIAAQLGDNCLNLAGKTSVRQLMALIKRCNFFVTNDSGPMHIAAAFGVPLVAIFGPTDHTGTAPYSDQAIIVRQDTDCAPCKLRECPSDHRCMTAVTADDVAKAALALVKPQASARDAK